jgi:hypothetical protein
LLFYIYISIVALAFLSSLISFKLDYPIHIKIFSILLGITLINEILANFFLKSIHLKSNNPIYNVFMLIEFWIYGLYYRYIIINKIIKIIITFFLFLFPAFWVITIFYLFNGLIYWNSYLIIVGFSATVIWSLLYCYQLFTSVQLVKFRKQSEFWIALGLIIFYTCNLPYLGMYNFLATNYSALAEQLKKVLQPTDCLMYSLFIYAYLCRTTNTMKSSRSS